MKPILTTLLLICPVLLFGQQVISEAARTPEFDINGDPQNNIIDPNGSRQGLWYYDSYNGETLLIEVWEENLKTTTQLVLEVDETESLVDQNEWTLLEGSTLSLTPSQLGFTSTQDRQLALVFDQNTLIKVSFLGNWNQAETTTISTSISQWSAANEVSFNSNFNYALILVQ